MKASTAVFQKYTPEQRAEWVKKNLEEKAGPEVLALKEALALNGIKFRFKPIFYTRQRKFFIPDFAFLSMADYEYQENVILITSKGVEPFLKITRSWFRFIEVPLFEITPEEVANNLDEKILQILSLNPELEGSKRTRYSL